MDVLWDEFGALQGQSHKSVGRSNIESANPVLQNVERFAERYDDEIFTLTVVEKLPPLHRKVLRLKYVTRDENKKHFTLGKIAQKLAVAESTAKRLHKNACDCLSVAIQDRERQGINGYDMDAHIRVLLKKNAREDYIFQVLS